MAQNGVPIDSKPITGQATGMTFHPVKSASGAEVKAPTLLLPLHEGRGTSLLQSHKGQSSALVSGLLGTQSHFQHCFYRKMLSELEATHSFFVLFSKFKKGAYWGQARARNWGIEGTCMLSSSSSAWAH